MARLLTQLFEITALFDMRLRPELVLLQKTMMTVEGVARRIDPDLDIWTAAEPVVRRWTTRELSPAATLRSLAADARAALASVPHLAAAERRPPPPDHANTRAGLGLWVAFALGAASAAVAFALAVWLR
jgi:ubiquinone biosynthesis protein